MSTSASSTDEPDELPPLASPPPSPDTPTVRVSETTPTSVVSPPPTITASTIRKSRGGRYSKKELLHLFDAMQKIKPIGPYEWEEVADAHSQQYPGRDVESLRRKYVTTHRRKVPTGDPTCPAEVRLAKRVKVLIGEKADLDEAENVFDMESNSFAGGEDGEDSGDELENNDEVVDNPESVSTAGSIGIRARLGPRKKPTDFAELMLLQMKADSEQRDHVARMREDERRDSETRREEERREAARVRDDEKQEAARMRAEERNERALDRSAAITLISGIASGYFSMVTETSGAKKRKLGESGEGGED